MMLNPTRLSAYLIVHFLRYVNDHRSSGLELRVHGSSPTKYFRSHLPFVSFTAHRRLRPHLSERHYHRLH